MSSCLRATDIEAIRLRGHPTARGRHVCATRSDVAAIEQAGDATREQLGAFAPDRGATATRADRDS